MNIGELNKFSKFIGPELSRQIPKPHHTIDRPCFDKTLVLDDTSLEEKLHIQKKLKSSGSDSISNEITERCSPVKEEHLFKAFNECLKIGIFPGWPKLAKVIALHKNSDYSYPENYRPISLLSSLSKVFEKVLYNQMNNFLLGLIF